MKSNCIKFVVNCRTNHQDFGNPQGKPSDTHPNRYTKDIKARLQKYKDWQSLVRHTFLTECISEHLLDKNLVPFELDADGKIIYNPDQYFALTVHCYCMNKKRSDLSNCIKAVEDSIWVNDHNVIGYPDMQKAIFIDALNPRIEVVIWVL